MCSVCQGVDHTVLSCQIVIAIPWEVQISMCGLPVYPYGEGSIWLWCYDGVQKGDGTIIFGFLNSKLDGRVHCVDVTAYYPRT